MNIVNSLYKVSEAEKRANENEWYKKMVNYLLPYSNKNYSYKNKEKLYKIANNDISGYTEEVKGLCELLDIGEEDSKEIIKAYPALHNKVNILKGELLTRNQNFKVKTTNQKILKEKDDLIVKEINRRLDLEVQAIVLEIQNNQNNVKKTITDEQIAQIKESLSPEDINQREYLTEWEILCNNLLRYAYENLSIKTKQITTLEDLIISDNCFLYSGFKNGKPIIEIRNPLYICYKNTANEKKIEKSEIISYNRRMLITEVLDNYNLSNDDIKKLLPTYPQFRNVINGNYEYSKSFEDSIIAYTMSKDHDDYGYINVEHIEFKAYRKVIFLSYIDETGNKITDIVPDSYEIPKDSTKEKYINDYDFEAIRYVWIDEVSGFNFTAEEIWIPRKYECERISPDVFVNCREVPNQEFNLDAPFTDFELSTKGVIINNNNSKSSSMLEKAVPFYFKYVFIMYLIDKELQNFRSFTQSLDVDQIPELEDDTESKSNTNRVYTYLKYLKKLNLDIYSGSQNTTGGGPNYTRSPGSTVTVHSTANEIINLQNLARMIDAEIGLSMGISPQRESKIQNNSNVTDNQLALKQSYAVTETLYYFHDEVWRIALRSYLKNFIKYLRKFFETNSDKTEHFINYFTPDGTDILFRVTPEHLNILDINLSVTNTSNDNEYLRMMINLSHAFAQNAGEGMESVSAIIKAITSGLTANEVHKIIQVEAEKQQKRAQAIQEQQLKTAEKMKQMEIENREDQQAHELELKAMDIYKFQDDLNTDKDGIPDPLEATMLQHKINKENEELRLKKQKLDQDNKNFKDKLNKTK